MATKLQVNTTPFKSTKEYVCWIDIMGTQNTMSESFQKAANFIFRFHSCVIDAVKNVKGVSYYPLMDGVFITSPNNKIIRKVINNIFSSVASIFLQAEKHGHRFIIKGALSFGDIAHGNNINKSICETLANEDDYKRAIMCGLPMIQAYTAEHIAPPFGVYIHESARTPTNFQGKHYEWGSHNNINKTELLNCIISYFNWCEYFNQYLEIDSAKISLYKKHAQEYFTNRMEKDAPDNPWNKL